MKFWGYIESLWDTYRTFDISLIFRDRTVLTLLLQIKAMVKINSTAIGKLRESFQAKELPAESIAEFAFPLACEADVRRVEKLLQDAVKSKQLVSLLTFLSMKTAGRICRERVRIWLRSLVQWWPISGRYYNNILTTNHIYKWIFHFIQVHYLSTFGCFKVKEVVDRIMSEVFTTPLACQYNWVGKGRKYPMRNLRLTRAIKGEQKLNTLWVTISYIN